MLITSIFFFSPQCFLHHGGHVSPVLPFFLLSASAVNLKSKILLFGKDELIL